MKFYILVVLCIIFSLNVDAATKINADCEKKVVKAALKMKESGLFLEYYVDGVVRNDLFSDYIQVHGIFSDADEDYSYTEVYEVGVKKNSCKIVSTEIVDIIEN
jgi:hypothetical protein